MRERGKKIHTGKSTCKNTEVNGRNSGELECKEVRFKITVPGDPANDSALLTTKVRDRDRGTGWREEKRKEERKRSKRQSGNKNRGEKEAKEKERKKRNKNEGKRKTRGKKKGGQINFSVLCHHHIK